MNSKTTAVLKGYVQLRFHNQKLHEEERNQALLHGIQNNSNLCEAFQTTVKGNWVLKHPTKASFKGWLIEKDLLPQTKGGKKGKERQLEEVR